MKTYKVKEIFSTLQGEGANAGRAAVFVRFAGCNLWTGREEDRSTGKGVCSRWCDTDFVGGTRLSASTICESVRSAWSPSTTHPFVVLTGGEPTLQVDDALLADLHAAGCEIAIETNGTRHVPTGVDWIAVSPKFGSVLAQTRGDEIRVAYPQWPREALDLFLQFDFRSCFISPIAGPDYAANLASAVEFCRTNPLWRLSLQLHKLGGFR